MKEIKPFVITKEHLVKIVSDEKFLSSLKKVKRCRRVESGFAVQQDYFTPCYKISDLVYGNSDDIDPDAKIDISYDQSYILMNLHSHDENDARPSPNDLCSLTESRENERELGAGINPINIILPQDYSGEISFLVLQEKPQFHIIDLENANDLIRELGESVYPIPLIEDVRDHLLKTGRYNVEILRLDKKMKYKEESLETLSSFTFTPRILNKKG